MPLESESAGRVQLLSSWWLRTSTFLVRLEAAAPSTLKAD